MKEQVQRREYGLYLLGSNNVVLVAPHGGDAHERKLSYSISQLSQEGAAVIINERIPRTIVDLNSMSKIKRSKSVASKHFVEDIQHAVERAMACCDAECFVFFIHNAPQKFQDVSQTFPRVNGANGQVENDNFGEGENRPYHLDIGAGVTWMKPKFDDFSVGDILDAIDDEPGMDSPSLRNWMPMAKEIWPKRGTGGVKTCPRDYLLSMVNLSRIAKLSWRVEIGREFAAQRRTNLSQAVYQMFKKHGRVRTAQFDFVDAVSLVEVRIYLQYLVRYFENFGLGEWDQFLPVG